VTHVRPHQDELFALWQLSRFGNRIYIGANTAKVVFIKKDWGRYPKDVILVGIGYGNYDEHRSWGRIANTCAATLVARDLRLEERLEGTLKEVLRCDTKNGVSPTQLANLIKAKHRVNNGANQHGTLRWAYDAFDAIVFGTWDESFDICVAWNEFLDAGGDKHEAHIVERVKNHVLGTSDRLNHLVTEMASIAGMMKPDMRSAWLATAFDVLLRDAELYEQALREVNETGRIVEIETGKNPEPVCVITTDNEHATSAFSERAGLASMLITRNSVGHTGIFISPRSQLPIKYLTAMIRMAEYGSRTGRLLPANGADTDGTLKECPQWHLANSRMLLNGSLTHPEVEASALSLDEIIDIVSSVFVDEKRHAWMREFPKKILAKSFMNPALPVKDAVEIAFAH
jgi:hypothetical protein